MSAFDKVIGYESIKVELRIVSDIMRNPEKYHSLGVTTPKGILLYGEPGIGKTLMAKSLIEESGRKAFTIRKDKPDGEFVNFIRETFEQAKKDAPSIVFLDDMDKFANEDYMHRDAEEYVTVQACIDETKGVEVFVLATANQSEDLPDSLKRPGRFDKVIEMRSPEGEEAEEIVKYFLSTKKISGEVDYREIARILDGRSCADLETIINEAGIYAAYDNRTMISHHDIIRACLRYIFDAPEEIEEECAEDKREIAIHEAGHAVAAEILDPGSVNLISISGYNGSTRGITSISKPEGYWKSKSLMEHKVIGLLAGKAATEIMCHAVDVGVASDIKRAFSIVERLVDDYCSYGFDSFIRHDSSEFVGCNKDRMLDREMNKYYEKAKDLIVDNRDFLMAVVEELLDKRTMTNADLKRIKDGLDSRVIR